MGVSDGGKTSRGKVLHIGVARGCTPRAEKKLVPNLQGKVVSALPQAERAPPAEQESNF